MASVATAVAQHKSKGDVRGQVNGMFEESLGALRAAPHTAMPELRRFPGVQAAMAVEEAMLENVDFLIDQLQADGRRAMPSEVRTQIIETCRDLKMTSVEQDGYVNPMDLVAIKLKAAGLKGTVRQKFMHARMFYKTASVSGQLDFVERTLLLEVTQKFGRNWAELQREAQAAICAVAELRIQQLATSDY